PGHEKPVTALAFSPNGRLLATGAMHEVKLWDLRSGRLERTLKDQYWGDTRSIAFSPASGMVAHSTNYGSLYPWNARTGEKQRVLRGRDGPVAFSPDGSAIVNAGSAAPLVWDARTGEMKNSPARLTYSPGAISFSPDGREVVIGGLLWDTTTW